MSQHIEPGRRALVKEFYSNLGERKDLTCYVRGRWIPFKERAISQILGLRQVGEYAEYEQLQKSPCFEEIAQELTNGLGQWQRTKTIINTYINRGDFTETNKVWFYLINSVFKPSKHVSTMRQDCILLLYALVKGFELDLGKIIEESILEYAENNFSGNIPHPTLITLLCIKRGLKVAEEEENSPKATPLTLTGVFKTLAEGKKGERIKKMRRIEEQPRETVHTVEAEREVENEEKGIFEDYTEQPVLFSTTVEETVAPFVKTENRGK